MWDPKQYLKFGDERLRPALDLLAQIPLNNPNLIYDLGCGTGLSTTILKDRWPDSRIVGVDFSEEMLEKARKNPTEIEWQRANLQDWKPTEKADLLFSNATYHWLKNHEKLFTNLIYSLNDEGILAIQMPNNFQAPTHTLIVETIKEESWSKDLNSLLLENPVSKPETYYSMLENSAHSINIWETTYFHILTGEDPVVNWTKGSILRPILNALDGKEKYEFLKLYTSKINHAYPKQNNGKTLLPYKRIFLVVQK